MFEFGACVVLWLKAVEARGPAILAACVEPEKRQNNR